MLDINFNQPIILEDSRVLLRPLISDDLEHLLPFALNEPELWKYYTHNAAGTEGMRQFIDEALSERQLLKGYPFIVYDKLNNAYAGCTRYYDVSPKYHSLSLGHTWYGKLFQGTGINKHCKFLLLRHAFEYMNVNRVEFQAHIENARSINAMKALGCVFEGVLRQNRLTYNGTFRDSAVLSILQSEWQGGVKEQLLLKLQGGAG